MLVDVHTHTHIHTCTHHTRLVSGKQIQGDLELNQGDSTDNLTSSPFLPTPNSPTLERVSRLILTILHPVQVYPPASRRKKRP